MMGETGAPSRVPGNLDPSAQEFRPRNRMPSSSLFVPPAAQTQICCCYPYPYPKPYPPSSPVQLLPFSDGYPHFPPSPVYVCGNSPSLSSSLFQPTWHLSATPTRTLLLSSVPTDVGEAAVRRELAAFGEVRSVQMERLLHEGIVAVGFYDLRHAQAALTEIREQHMQQQTRLRNHYNSLLFPRRNSSSSSPVEESPAPPQPLPARGIIAGRAVWAQFMIPTTGFPPDGHNQGTLVIFNLDPEVSTNNLREIFETFGPIKELRETPLKPHQRFVEFYDIRDAARARGEMKGKEIQGKRVAIEFSRPGGYGKRVDAGTGTGTGNANNNNIPTCPPTLPRKPSEKSSPPNITPRSCFSQTRSSTEKSSRRSSNVGTIQEAASTTSSPPRLTTASAVNGIGDSSSGFQKQQINPKKTTTTTKQQQQALRNQLWRERQKTCNSRFLINQDAIAAESHFRDSRTTVMIKNIPNKYSQKLLMNMLDNHCLHCNEQILEGEEQPQSSYDFLYLPIDFNNKCNVGYGFVNMTSPQATVRLYRAFHLQSWEVFNSSKICEITYARVQGLEALKEHFKNSKFLCETKEYLPVMFSPPRDGRQLTEPEAIAGHNDLFIGIINNGGKASDHDDEDDEEEQKKMITTDGPDRVIKNGNDDDDDDRVCECNDDNEQPEEEEDQP